MNTTYNKATNTIAKANAAKYERPMHPAEKTSRASVYSKNYSKQKPRCIKQAGRTLAD